MTQEHGSEAAQHRAALMALFETHYERVTRYIAVRIGSIDDAEDLASDVFVRALKAVDSYHDTGAPMEAWIFRIAHNCIVDHLRSRGRHPAAVQLQEALAVGGTDNPQEHMERSEEVAFLAKAMKQLSENQRQVLSLRFGAEMTSEEVARTLGKKPGAVREMQSAAIGKLRQIMKV